MKFPFLIGLIISIVASLIGVILNDYNITFKITGFVVVSSFLISGILNGTFISGDRYRANLIGETKEDRDKKMKIIKYALFISIPNIIIFIILFALKN